MRKLSIGKKLGWGFGGLLGAMILLGALSLWAISTLRGQLEDMNGKILKKSMLTDAIHMSSLELRADIRGSVLGASLNHPQEFQKYRDAVDEDFTKLNKSIAEIRPLLVDPRGLAALDGIAATLPPFKASYNEVADLCAAGKITQGNQLRMDKQVPLANTLEKGANDLSAITQEVAAGMLKDADRQTAMNRLAVAGVILAGIIIGLFVFGMVRGLLRTLRQTVKDLSAGGEQVASASGQIAATSQTLSQGASEQAASIEEISASMEEMTAMTKRNSDNSSEATAMMAETVKQVERSNAALADMVTSMSAIKISSEKVAKINKTIDEIAFQTNILALNAAVEAARAGEAGMGFAVVADEVRNLAQRSAVAAKDTAALIEESIANANQGTEKLELVSSAVHGITEGAGKVKNLLDEVNEASKQQGQGIQQVSTAISQVSTVTQTAAASAEESAAASEELNAQSQTVRDLVQTLAEVVEGANHHSELKRPMLLQTARSAAKSKAPAGMPKHDDPFPMEPMETGSFREF